MKVRPRGKFADVERPREEIVALRPTVDEEASWAAQRRHHAWMVFWKFSVPPGGAILGIGLLRHGLRMPWRIWLITAAVACGVAAFSWFVRWRLEEPKRKLKLLRATRLYSALVEAGRVEDASVPPHGAD